MSQGWIALHRQIQDTKLWNREKFSKAQAWIDLLLSANHENKTILVDYKKIEIKRGQFMTSQVKLAESWKWDRETVKRFLNYLENEKMVSTECHTQFNKGFTIITIIKYNDYQTVPQPMPQPMPQANRSLTRINNNENNENNVKQSKKEKIIKKEKDFNPLSSQQLADIALNLQISLENVQSKHDGIVEMWESGDFEAKYPKNKTLIGTLRNWLRMDIERGNIKRMSSEEADQLKIFNSSERTSLEGIAEEFSNGLPI